MISRPLRVGIIAGEASGDILGAGLIKALKSQHSNLTFIGIGGPKMIAEGCESLEPMETLSVMGLIEVIRHIRPLLAVRKKIIQCFTDNPPDIFIGIDAPDFCLPVAKKLKQRGIKTVQYVSPSVWAWRQGRVHGIKRSVDTVLCLFPFEKAFYDRFDMHATFIGHTLADQFPLEPDTEAARTALGLPLDTTCVALMPGSRLSEIARMLPLYLETAVGLIDTHPGIQFLIPAVNAACSQAIAVQVAAYPHLQVRIVEGDSQRVMTAADALLMTSGTATLEAMLLKKPTVVSYKMATLSWWLVKWLVKIEWAALPNLLAERALMPEYLQDQAQAALLIPAMGHCLEQGYRDDHIREFHRQHVRLRRDADQRAADAVLALLS